MSGSNGIISSLFSRFRPPSVVTISGITADDAGNIELVSPDDSIAIEAVGSGQHEVRFILSDRDDGSTNGGPGTAELQQRIDALDRYFIERSFRVVAQEYETVSRRFDVREARSIVGHAINALGETRAGELDAVTYRESTQDLIHPQREVLTELEGRIPPRDVTAISEGLDELEDLIREDSEAVEIARVQIHIAEYLDVFLDPPRIE